MGVGEELGSAVALGDGSTEGVADGLGSGDGLGLAEGSGESDGWTESAGAGVIAGAGVAESTGLGRGVAVIEGSAVGVARSRVGVGVTTGPIVAPAVNTGSRWTTCDAAKTKAPPSNATDRMVTISVPVVRIAPRTIWVRRSDSHER